MYNHIYVVECNDHRVTYGILRIKDISTKEVQDKINEIKERFSEEGIDWIVDDVFEEFQSDWDWEWIVCDNNPVEI